MKKLKQLKLQSAVVLQEKEMKAVHGGSGSKGSGMSCWAACCDYKVYIDDCLGDCYAAAGVGVWCNIGGEVYKAKFCRER